jgi:hypothetical protein
MFISPGSRILRKRSGPYPSVPTSIFANLPQSPTNGQLAFITDSSTATWGANISGSGANKVLAQWNGSHWTVIGT